MSVPLCMNASDKGKYLLETFDSSWRDRHRRFRAMAAPPWWTPDVVITPEMRHQYELYLPIAEFCRNLRALARGILSHPSWTPRVLGQPEECTGRAPRAQTPPSLPDLWARLPAKLAGRVTFEADELLPFFCALADPGSFGTAPRRYPEQLAALRREFAEFAKSPLRMLDLGCGVGHGTLEAASAAVDCGVRNLRAIGVTREPLEAWMAANRDLPHDPARTAQLRDYPLDCPVHFIAADLLQAPLSANFDVILCNGVVGERFVNSAAQFSALLAELARLLAPGGIVFLADHFHEGARKRTARFARSARENGWQVTGAPGDLLLRREE